MSARLRRIALASALPLLMSTSCQRASSPALTYVGSGPPRYEIECPVGEPCDASVALLVGLSAPSEPMRCTAALIGPRTAVTAGHCVAWELATGGDCRGVWLGFPDDGERAGEWVGCDRIVSASPSSETLLSPDYAVLELSSELDRPPIPLGAGAVRPGEVVRMVTVTSDRFYDRVHEVRSRRCVVDDNGSLRPWNPVAPPTIRVLSSCPVREGASGAPVLDRYGHMRGLIHAGGPRYFAYGLMTLLPQPPQDDDG